MFRVLNLLDLLIAFWLPVPWLLAGYGTGRLAFQRTPGQFRLVAWASLALLGVAGLLVAARLLTLGGLWATSGWWFVVDRVVVALPPLILPALAALLIAVPGLLRVALGPRGAPEQPLDAAGRRAVASPLRVVPVQAAAVGASLSGYLAWFAPAAPPYQDEVLIVGALFALAAAALWLRQEWRARTLGRPAPRLPGPGLRLLRALAIGLALCLAIPAGLAAGARATRLPDRIGLGGHAADHDGGPAGGHEHGHQGATSVAALTGPRTGEPDARFTLTAQQARVPLSSGAAVDAWTFNGQIPGPELRVRQGDLVQVTLINRDIAAGVTIHWHGVDVPNAEDGVAGVTQDAVQPGQTFTYRFRMEQAGTFWYHSHQQSSEQVRRGLFGALVSRPREAEPAGELDLALAAHSWRTAGDRRTAADDGGEGGALAFGTADTLRRQAVAPGTPVRLRLINTDSLPRVFRLTGAPFRVAAIDGSDLHEPGDLADAQLLLAAGGRYDLTFTMPDTPVLLAGSGDAGLLLSRDGAGTPPANPANSPLFDPARYGRPRPTPFGLASRFDREFVLVLDNRLGFHDGRFTLLWTINGQAFPDTPMLMVREGDLVKLTFVNRSFMDHPMHLHGHHVLVLSRNGQPTSGSPWWTDTLNVAPGETYDIAFRADNPGIWMDHCHNLDHAAAGMVMHLGYEGVTSPFEVGRATGNQPE